MNKSQLIVLWVGIAFFIIFGLSTPTQYRRGGGFLTDAEPVYLTDYGPLTVRVVTTLLVTAGLIITLKKSDNLWRGLTIFWNWMSKGTEQKSKDEQKQ